jgi:uncharacterized membrane protein YkvI
MDNACCYFTEVWSVTLSALPTTATALAMTVFFASSDWTGRVTRYGAYTLDVVAVALVSALASPEEEISSAPVSLRMSFATVICSDVSQ